ncbi:hypothetical protein DOS68_03335 [Staphylococcus felis]|uniref:LapA family protein n=1 Tax=Staphylococcus felis TaxID=46127 RepID=A0AAX1RXK4_9STAP|nr:hypothetical protein [Staphylococcus felis]AVP36972.1 hypothetical protein C7J90_08385 [Staphylococcus felis]MBH9579946.1 hypothetical protein [Staphylococcus felis]PNZ33921.1 hypothetical protein CD143_10345 [Staphylococcus felis]QQB03074.1 hypothetical protein I6H71_10130 [Staphylococcus felis]REH78426.1 hypothetical protein DOS57_04450 [Staphylococcus felis]
MKSLKENRLSILIIIFAIIIGFILQTVFHLPLIAGAFIGVLLGILGGFIIQVVLKQNDRTSYDQKDKHDK